jgi:hypothetical protein
MERAEGKRRKRVLSATVRYLVTIPAGAPKLERLRWTRNVCLTLALPSIPVLIFLALQIDETWVYVAFGVWALVWLGGLMNLSLDIRRTRLADRADPN